MTNWFIHVRQNMSRPATAGEVWIALCVMPAIAIGTFMLLITLVGNGR